MVLMHMITCFSLKSVEQYYVDMDSVLFYVLNLQTKTAKNMLNAEGVSFNLYKEYLYNWADVIEITLLENDDRYEKYTEEFEARLDRIEKFQDKEASNYYILLAEMYAHAAMAQIVYNEYLSGFRKLLKSNRYAKKSMELHPNYWRNNKLCGTLNVSFDMLPAFTKSMAAMFGLTGDASKGFAQIEQYLIDVSHIPSLKTEGLLYKGVALKLTRDEPLMYSTLQENTELTSAPAIMLYLLSNVALLSGHNEACLTYLNAFPTEEIELPFKHINYLKGKAKLNRLDTDADVFLKDFLEHSDFKNFRREVCVKLSHFYFINKNTTLYEYYKAKVDTYPKSTIQRDLEANIENNRPYPPHRGLLKARYLVQGGYFQRSYNLLIAIQPESLAIDGYKNEYFLLLAQSQNGLKMPNEALSLCNKMLAFCTNTNDHYVAEAALLASNIELQRMQLHHAKMFCKSALEIKGEDDVYMENIHKRAKNRLKKIEKLEKRGQNVRQPS